MKFEGKSQILAKLVTRCSFKNKMSFHTRFCLHTYALELAPAREKHSTVSEIYSNVKETIYTECQVYFQNNPDFMIGNKERGRRNPKNRVYVLVATKLIAAENSRNLKLTTFHNLLINI